MAVRIPVDAQAIAAFCQRNHIRKLAFFGSVVRDDFSAASDIDVLVEFEPEHVPGFAFVDMQDELARLLGRRVDLSTPGFLSPYVRDRIEHDAYLLYVAD